VETPERFGTLIVSLGEPDKIVPQRVVFDYVHAKWIQDINIGF
jgi:hypothetical protein